MNTSSLLQALSTVAENPQTFSERLLFSLKMLAFGMGVVFAVLALIWLILVLFRLVTTAVGKRKQTGQTPAQAPVATPSSPAADDGAILAAITAAVAVIIDEENAVAGTDKGFRVVSFGKAGAPWDR